MVTGGSPTISTAVACRTGAAPGTPAYRSKRRELQPQGSSRPPRRADRSVGPRRLGSMCRALRGWVRSACADGGVVENVHFPLPAAPGRPPFARRIPPLADRPQSLATACSTPPAAPPLTQLSPNAQRRDPQPFLASRLRGVDANARPFDRHRASPGAAQRASTASARSRSSAAMHRALAMARSARATGRFRPPRRRQSR